MFDWVLNTSLIGDANQLSGFYLIRMYIEKSFQQAIETWILIPIISRNIFKLHAKKIHIKYNKICFFEKNTQGIILTKTNLLELNGLGFLCYSVNHVLTCSGVI